MRCQSCGHLNSDQAQFCAACGFELGASSGESLKPGQTMNGGQYRVMRELGRGGMGAIYLAQNTQAFNRLCVVKEMIAYYEPGEEQKAQARFEQEARTLATLKHPGIPDIYGFFSEGGHHYIVMEYIEGENLEKLLEGSAGSPGSEQEIEGYVGDLVRYGVEICRVLEHLAQVKPEPMVHCDIKPANIIIDKNSDQAVLVDFGTAKTRYLRSPAHQPDAERASVYGTVGYAPPELYRGQAVPKSDVFSLAATLYHLLTHDDPRDHPFKWPKMDEIPSSLRLLLSRALEIDLDQRLGAEQFRRQLEAYRAAQAGTLRPLSFPEGNVATTVTGVLDLSLKYWDYARRILYDGSLDTWLRNALHDPVTADRAVEAVRRYPDSPNAGLNALVRELNPRLPESQLSLSPDHVDLGTVASGATAKAVLTVANQGPGGSHGTITSSQPWLAISPTHYALGPQEKSEVHLRLVDTKRLAARSTHAARITLRASSGQTLQAEARVRTGPRPVAPKAVPRPSRPVPTKRAKPRPQPVRAATPRKSKWVGLLLALALLIVAGAAWAVYHRGPGLSDAAFERAMTALETKDWSRAIHDLSRTDPNRRDQVHQVARALDATLVRVPGGRLQMGREDGTPDESPAHAVEIAALYVDRFEVTNAQFQRFVDETGHPPPRYWAGGRFPRGQALRPVVGVTWKDANAYAAWAGKRLPTEAEWEWAARGEEGRLYPWGNESDPSRENSESKGPGHSAEVGSYPLGATALGIMDLAGNVREWTADRYAPYRLPHAPPTMGDRMAVRGSSWRTYDNVATAREWVERDTYADDLGFRCVREDAPR